MLKVKDLINELQLNEYAEEFAERNCGYISDVISEIADANVSIYYDDIKTFIYNNFDYVDQVIDEFGWEDCGSNLYKVGQTAEYMKNEEEIYEGITETFKLVAYNYHLNEYGEEISEEQNEELTRVLEDEYFDSIEWIQGFVDNLVKGEW